MERKEGNRRYQDARAEQMSDSLEKACKVLTRDPMFGVNHRVVLLNGVEAFNQLSLRIKKDSKEKVIKRLGTRRLIQLIDFWNLQEHTWQKQITNGISGVIWIETEFCGKSITLPELSDNLILAFGDKDIITASKDEAIAWLKNAAVGFKVWHCTEDKNGCYATKSTWKDFVEATNRIEWIQLRVKEDGLCVALCWGTPGHHFDLDAAPTSGTTWFHFGDKPSWS